MLLRRGGNWLFVCLVGCLSSWKVARFVSISVKYVVGMRPRDDG